MKLNNIFFSIIEKKGNLRPSGHHTYLNSKKTNVRVTDVCRLYYSYETFFIVTANKLPLKKYSTKFHS